MKLRRILWEESVKYRKKRSARPCPQGALPTALLTRRGRARYDGPVGAPFGAGGAHDAVL